jgi:hypothetical protein
LNDRINRKNTPMNCPPKATLPAALSLAATFLCVTVMLSATRLLAEVSPKIAVQSGVPMATYHAEGSQIYQCERVSERGLEWQSRELIATLISDGETVGRQYSGQHWGHVDPGIFRWEHRDGSMVQAKVAASVAAAASDDVPWLRLNVTSQNGDGALYGVTAVQRINTRGGRVGGPCDQEGNYRSVPYSADYVFWRED